MIIKQENDSIYIAADTLFSGRMSDLLKSDSSLAARDTLQGLVTSDTLQVLAARDTISNRNDSADRYFQAYHHVRIYSDSMQAVADSMIYLGRDSVFRLFTEPVMWTGNSQVTGDTIYLLPKQKPQEVQVFENGIAVENRAPTCLTRCAATGSSGISPTAISA
jgi:hypothetical protein